MFPLQLLALLFISTPSHDPKEKGRKKEREEEADGGRGERMKSKYDLMFRRGDLLEVPRTLFTHFGIYLGAGRVAHFIPDIMPVVSSNQCRIKQMVTNSRLLLGVLAKCGSVRVDSVEDFAYGSEILINTTDKVCSRPALRGEEVAVRAEKLRGDVSYSLLWYNCEHFVMYCRYGTVVSFQTFQFCKTVRKLLLSRRVAKVTAVLGACLLLYLRAVSTYATLLAVLLPFLIWMAS
ncbi:lecithin retinol acyltransferase-like isoform X2 [Seriola lalandi dorsalis]|uniref:Lecithin retinol acyltransferase b, tandem duplicate 2 n=1 Tax=Seriola lalandi dorsalis TaxID=1841481 RepID=A0A3B4XUK9_SERLL|nr:lecithin retinol acyltransferase-like isoform X2 [Seriola lalandi dorsalis]XP_056225613.1 lecithin retinol acyltransferase b, tandem duplicate 2 [Seriola aureovittata]